MTMLLLFLAFFVASHAAPQDIHFYQKSPINPLEKAWVLFKAEHGKTYASVEEEYNRQKVFAENLKIIESHNYLYDMGLKAYKMGINKFSDQTSSEFKKMMTRFKMNERKNEESTTYLPLGAVTLPESMDWRKEGYVTAVKDQGGCGSCWAFSATGALEGQNKRKSGKLLSLSEQNLIDCSQNQGNSGCSGGLMDKAFKYIQQNGGIDTEESYPYDAADEECRYTEKNRGATVTGFVDIPEGNETLLMEAVATVGPVSVAINAITELQHYKSGIFDDPNCNPQEIDHGVLAVGYGSEGGHDYWIVKNSWGLVYGENGYIRMSRNKGNQCGIATLASYPLV